MENEKVVVLQLKLGRKHCLFALAFAFLCFHPRPLGSETLTLSTYYPAPYGGYIALLTTGGTAGTAGVNTLLARDAGNVGIGTTNPSQKLDVFGNARFNGYTFHTDSTVNGLIGPVAADGFLYLVTTSNHGISFGTNNAWSRMVISNTGSVGVGTPPSGTDLAGDLRVAGSIRNVCTGVCYGTSVTLACPGVCPANHRVVGFGGDGVPRVSGFMPADASGGGIGTYVVMGEDWGGTMICCKLPG